jgi:hypothetical protein
MGGEGSRPSTDGAGTGSAGRETPGALDGALLGAGGFPGAPLAAGGLSSSISPGGSPIREPVRVKEAVAVSLDPATPAGALSFGAGLTAGAVGAGLALGAGGRTANGDGCCQIRTTATRRTRRSAQSAYATQSARRMP